MCSMTSWRGHYHNQSGGAVVVDAYFQSNGVYTESVDAYLQFNGVYTKPVDAYSKSKLIY
jgi:hypothetical protein